MLVQIQRAPKGGENRKNYFLIRIRLKPLSLKNIGGKQ